MMKWWIVVIAVSVSGCKSSKPKPEDDKGSSTPATGSDSAGFPKLSVTIDGKPVVMATALAKAKPDGSVQLYLSPNKVVTCQELLTNVFNDRGLTSVLVDLPMYLGADGKETGGATGIYMGTPTEADPGGTSKLSGPPTKGSAIDIDLVFTGKSGRGGEKIEVKGSLTAQGCGDHPADTGPGIPKTPHPTTASMTIAGKKFPIRGAIQKGDTIELSDFPRDCLTAWFVGARVRRTGAVWTVDGQRFVKEAKTEPAAAGSGSAGSGSGSAADAPPAMTLAIKPGKAAPGTGSGSAKVDATLELALDGEGKIGDYPVKLEGTIEALDCK